MARNELILQGRGLVKEYGSGARKVAAVNDASFGVRGGQIVSLVGESGSGKTTLAKIILGLARPDAGELCFDGRPFRPRRYAERIEYWRHVQAVFQDPFSSFNQFCKIERFFTDCLRLTGRQADRAERERFFAEACAAVNMTYGEIAHKYPFELSGGQMQRLMLARILLIGPEVLVADEPTSMIDACTRSAILDVLLEMRKRNGMTIVFITHDLGLAYYVSDAIIVMRKGRIVEQGETRGVIEDPRSEYTRTLVRDVPKLNESWLDDGEGATR